MIWEANKNYVDNHNQNAEVFGFTLAMNEFADMVSDTSTQTFELA